MNTKELHRQNNKLGTHGCSGSQPDAKIYFSFVLEFLADKALHYFFKSWHKCQTVKGLQKFQGRLIFTSVSLWKILNDFSMK